MRGISLVAVLSLPLLMYHSLGQAPLLHWNSPYCWRQGSPPIDRDRSQNYWVESLPPAPLLALTAGYVQMSHALSAYHLPTDPSVPPTDQQLGEDKLREHD